MAKYIKPTLDTKFHIDFLWWTKKGENLRAYLANHTCEPVEELYEAHQDEKFDWISPETGEVFQIDILWHLIRTECSQDPDFFDRRLPLTSAIFRTFIINNNLPLTAIELYERIQKSSPGQILRTIGGRRIYKGIRPVEATR